MKKIILIDNDNLIHTLWKRECLKNDIELISFLSIDDFLEHMNEQDRDITIYLDSDLGDGIRGEVDGIKIFNEGFHNIILQTGHATDDVDAPEWIASVQGKRPKF